MLRLICWPEKGGVLGIGSGEPRQEAATRTANALVAVAMVDAAA